MLLWVDKLLLLAEGKTVYLGDAKKASDFFASVNYPCPTNFNPADHFVQVLAVVPGKEEEHPSLQKRYRGCFCCAINIYTKALARVSKVL